MPKRLEYETDDEAFPSDAYTVKGYKGIAWRVLGWELEYLLEEGWLDEETDIYYEGTEYEEHRTGRVMCHMIGDNHKWLFDPSELTALADLDYCAICGQTGCTHDGRDRE